ncbi:3-deoxy-7-phosphoheptulonate synthase [Paraherbaspirillum soli]|uniref:Phospho-2-dehydro-3-deoxyheptonate aldolase n=1 Tax=Paraherbaspirillum soli TaxID=631222 RepID=A0ABW0M8H4_9BURK
MSINASEAERYPTRLKRVTPVMSPAQLCGELRNSVQVRETVQSARRALTRILHRHDDRLAVIVGPCSIHDVNAARDYAEKLAALRQAHRGDVDIIMRAYFEKPRTTDGWKGLLNDPHLNGSSDIELGLRLARSLLLDINLIGLPVATEFLEPCATHFISDLVAWGAIGARTAESQIHRQLASGLSCPIGFKNGTDGNVKIAADAVKSASAQHQFLTVGADGVFAGVWTTGNPDCHIVLRGGVAPNYDAASVADACLALAQHGLAGRVMIDASHGNSRKLHDNQLAVCENIAGQLAGGSQAIVGVMIESNLVCGRQDFAAGRPLTYGQSITDACIAWDDTVRIVERLAQAVRQRRDALSATTKGFAPPEPKALPALPI